jgi:hypothetical protein
MGLQIHKQNCEIVKDEQKRKEGGGGWASKSVTPTKRSHVSYFENYLYEF